ncbi:anaphase-promoting complex subunit 2 [Rhypophila decipiens]|uniref:Anaphase-promoting complex subunit 2 n=1 Tax=Rhypophila decipiens TaxID=261697 RepID=A0AAN6Y347_9PEZI|nr:anaphase-promoting complex subunit 2 [Rhypophila decipiens]
MPAAVASRWQQRRRRVFQSVFQTDASLPTPSSTPSIPFPDQGQPFGGPAVSSNVHQYGTGAPSTTIFSQAATRDTLQPLQGQPFTTSTPTTLSQSTIAAASQSQLTQPFYPSIANAADDQIAYDRAWHVVTARIALPSSATADDSFGTLAPESQLHLGSDVEFYQALNSLVHAQTVLPRAAHTNDIVAWHAQQVRGHFTQHVIPLLAGCVEEDSDYPVDGGYVGIDGGENAKRGSQKGNDYERHMVTVMSSIRTLKAALRLYFYGLGMLVRGFSRTVDGLATEKAKSDAETMALRFRRDIHALVSISASDQLIRSIRVVLVRLVSQVLGIPVMCSGKHQAQSTRPSPPHEGNLEALAARQRLHELAEQLYNVGLGGERFQILFAEIMDQMMSAFVNGAYAGVWAVQETIIPVTPGGLSLATAKSSSSPCILSLGDWVENHFSRLSYQVLSRISPDVASPVTLADLKTYLSLALGRLAALRISELFDIVLAWPSSRGALDDLRATVTTSARRTKLTSSFSRALQTRLLHPGHSTLEILETYIAIIHTFHALDHSKVLLGHIEPSLQLYLCQREDAIRIVVTGLLASPEEVLAARKVSETKKKKADRNQFLTPAMPGRSSETPGTRSRGDSSADASSSRPTSSGTLVELALLLNDPAQTRRVTPEDEELDWNDMQWVPDPVDAGANYKRPKSEDVIGTLISALGSEDVFIKEFTSIIAERLLGDPVRFDQELRVLDLLKRRFGEAALQNCDVMIKDVQDSRRLDTAIRRTWQQKKLEHDLLVTPAGPASRQNGGDYGDGSDGTQYHARILSRLFWPSLEREHFVLPQPIVEEQRRYELGYENLKSRRKLTWLNQLGQTRVELELRDRTVCVDCSTIEATVIYAFQDENDPGGSNPVSRSADDLYMQLQMDEDLIAAALTFWTTKGVLRRVQPGVYTVVESLTPGPEATDAPAEEGVMEGEADTEEEAGDDSSRRQPTKPAVSAKELERQTMYWQYIRGMLTNASVSMPLGQVAMMMKMLIPDGFKWSNEELLDFLSEKLADGDLEIVGGKYKLVKK